MAWRKNLSSLRRDKKSVEASNRIPKLINAVREKITKSG
jgi:hypothetical protein